MVIDRIALAKQADKWTVSNILPLSSRGINIGDRNYETDKLYDLSTARLEK